MGKKRTFGIGKDKKAVRSGARIGRGTSSLAKGIVKLTRAQVQRICTLAGVSSVVSTKELCLDVGISRETFEAWLSTPKGKQLWETNCVKGRTDFLIAMHRMSITSGDAILLGHCIRLMEKEYLRRLDATKIPAAELEAMMGISHQELEKRTAAGDMIPAGPDGAYALGDLLRFLPVLQAKLESLQRQYEEKLAATNASFAGVSGSIR